MTTGIGPETEIPAVSKLLVAMVEKVDYCNVWAVTLHFSRANAKAVYEDYRDVIQLEGDAPALLVVKRLRDLANRIENACFLDIKPKKEGAKDGQQDNQKP